MLFWFLLAFILIGPVLLRWLGGDDDTPDNTTVHHGDDPPDTTLQAA